MNYVSKAFVLVLVMSAAVPAKAEEVVATVKGLVCSFCAQGIKKTFAKHPDVLDTKVDLDSKLVTLTLKDGNTVPDEEIEKLITDAGYAVLKIEREGRQRASAPAKGTPCEGGSLATCSPK